MEEPTVSEQMIQGLRTKFFQKVIDDAREFHPKDINKVTCDDNWLRRFLLHHDLDFDDALNMLLETCEWRKTQKVHEINEETVNRTYLQEGSLFVHSRDKDGKSLFIFKCKKHVKGQKDFEELKKIVIYWFERLERQDKGDQMTIFFDMAYTGLANMDMEYTKYLISLCELYYPYMLNYIIIFEMPWILNAAFKVIKSWLPAKAVQKIKFVNKSTLKYYVLPDQALICWGGNDAYEFVFEPEMESRSEDNKKKVHFADGSPMIENPQSHMGDGKHDDMHSSSSRLKITPWDAIEFIMEGMEMSGSLNILNISDTPVTYKVKTTSPEKFRVRPSCGCLLPGSVALINVVLQAGYAPSSVIRDKFLIMSFSVDTPTHSNTDLNDLWKNCDSKKVEQHRLKCCVSGLMSHNGSPGSHTVSSSNQLSSPSCNDIEYKTGKLIVSVNQMNENLDRLQRDVKISQVLNFILLIMMAFCLMIMYGQDPGSNSIIQPAPPMLEIVEEE